MIQVTLYIHIHCYHASDSEDNALHKWASYEIYRCIEITFSEHTLFRNKT